MQDGRKYVDCFYYLRQEESNGLPYTIYPRGGRLCAVSLSECYENPLPLMKIFQERLNLPLNYGSRFNATDFFGYQFLVFDSNRDLSFFHPNQDKQTPQNDFLLLDSLINTQGVSIYQKNVSPQVNDATWKSLQSSIFFEKDSDRLCITTRKIKSSDPEAKLLFNIAKNSLIDFSTFPTYLYEMMECKVKPSLIETTKEYPLQKFVEEAKSCLEEAIVFAHYFYSQFITTIERKAVLYPQEVLSFYLTNKYIINISRSELLSIIQQKYPTYEYPKILENTPLTKSEFRFPLQESDSIDQQPFDLKIKICEEDIHIKEVKADKDIEKYIDSFNISIEIFHMSCSENTNADEITAVKILEKLPCFDGNWRNQPVVTAVDSEIFWGKQGDLRYALYDPPYGTTGKDVIALFDENFVNLLFFGKPSKEWVVFSSTTDNEYFINEWWDYLWIAFSIDRTKIIVIAATATD